MPDRRCRKSSALFLCGVLVLFFWQGTAYPVDGYWSNAAKLVLAQVQGNGVTESATENGSEAGNITEEENKLDYQVVIERGETLWSLAQRYQTTVEELAVLNGITSPDLIKAGQKLKIFADDEVAEVVVVEVNIGGNDSSEIAVEYPPDLKSWNTEDGIQTIEIIVTDVTDEQQEVADQKQEVADQKQEQLFKASATAAVASRGETYVNVTPDELELLARIIHAEARGEDFEGQVAVAAVVLNRVASPQFPHSIREVIYQPGAFTAVDDNQIMLTPDEQAYEAAQAALEGEDPTDGALYYYNPKTATDKWIKTRPVVRQIGNHVFSI